MDIINPEIRVIGQRYYRINNISISVESENNYTRYIEESFNDEECDLDLEDNDEFEIVKEDNMFASYPDIANMFYSFIIGKRGETKKKVEIDTKTKIFVPKADSTSETFSVKGETRRSVERALSRISFLVEHGREVSPLNHFFSIKMNDVIRSSFLEFRQNVLKTCIGDREVSENIFQKPEKLHLTLVMLVLGNHKETEKTIEAFHDFKTENSTYFTTPMTVRIKGLEYMNDDPCEVRVLYGKVEPSPDSERLQRMCDHLSDFLVDRHILPRREHDKVKLHMTLMNSSFNKAATQTASFDCSNLLEHFLDWDFGELCIDQLELSRRFTVQDTGYYTPAAVLPF